MRISDWSSDVCSSDLHDIRHARGRTLRVREGGDDLAIDADRLVVLRVAGEEGRIARARRSERGGFGIFGREQDRKSGGEGKSVSVSVGLGGRRSIKQKKDK